jgi:hypothetical protein
MTNFELDRFLEGIPKDEKSPSGEGLLGSALSWRWIWIFAWRHRVLGSY